MVAVEPTQGVPAPLPGPGNGGGAYRLLLWSLRVAWGSCAVGTAAMVPALVLRSPAMVTVFETGLLVSLVALTAAGLLFGGLLALPRPAARRVTPGGLRRQADLLLTIVLADLLDPD